MHGFPSSKPRFGFVLGLQSPNNARSNTQGFSSDSFVTFAVALHVFPLWSEVL